MKVKRIRKRTLAVLWIAAAVVAWLLLEAQR